MAVIGPVHATDCRSRTGCLDPALAVAAGVLGGGRQPVAGTSMTCSHWCLYICICFMARMEMWLLCYCTRCPIAGNAGQTNHGSQSR